MPERKTIPGSAEDWFARARSDLAFARLPLPEGAYYEDLCFHAQQAAEKALKAIYQFHNWAFRYTHDLEELISGLRQNGINIPSDIDEAIILTSFAWETRYPGLCEAVTEEEYREALKHAEAILLWTEKEINF